jgi:RNA recognition motif-containing protein
LFVTGLSSSLRDEELRELFEAHAAVEQASIVRDPHSRDSRGFGFVNMMTPEDADTVIEKLNGYELGGRSISIEKAKRNRPRTPTPGRYQGPPKRGK